MALSTPTLLNSVTATNNAATIASGSVSPTGGALLLAVLGGWENFGITPTYTATDTFTGTGSWTTSIVQTVNNGDNDYLYLMIAWAIAGGTPGSGAVTLGTTQSTFSRNLHLIEIATGFDAGTPIVQNKVGASTATTLSITLDSAVTAGNMVLGVCLSAVLTGGITVGTDFTELADTEETTDDLAMQTQYDATPSDATCDWSGLSTEQNAGIVIEIGASASGGPAGSSRESARGQTRGRARGRAA